MQNAQCSLQGDEAQRRAWSLLFEDTKGFTDSFLSEGKLKSLEGSTETVEGINSTLHVTQGRFSKTAIESVIGKKEIPIVSSHSLL